MTDRTSFVVGSLTFVAGFLAGVGTLAVILLAYVFIGTL